ncbi:MAG: dihydrofolate reductase [Clostridia bacterium]|nr:dihydrofolate reductase [Clostridia bacterium]
MNLIVSVDDRWGIGKGGGLLFRIREDMKRFRRLTVGRTVVLGRKTMDTFPDGKPLADRVNIVLTRSGTFRADGARICRSEAEVFRAIRDIPSDDVFIIGGESVYRLFLRFCRYAYITRVDGDFGADAFLPDLDKEPGWRVADPGETMCDGERTYRWVLYVNEHPEAYPLG